ncbi:glycoside hydrolase family 127 protein [Streptomyces regalis]|uniref:Non-reducing end beta-L-arabinofuranosidase-like GH127 catalytic domain-containing protein n=1 Tax=Streptomyces regalis TaxID=68262 RepID=A0A101JA61_9ACTN|nr:hypothetical protein ADL12_40615 [Streptomyces regalis]
MSTGPLRLTSQAHTALRPADAARVTDGFWAARRRTNAEVSIPQGPAKLEEAGNLANLRAAAGGAGSFAGDFQFQDSDVHKWLEAASWQLPESPGLAASIGELVRLLATAQEPDGYLQTYYQLARPDRRWQELGWGHELYCAGHLIQAAVAHHRTSGRRDLLDVAVRFAEHIDATFGPDKAVDGICGHPEIETALVELYRETGEQRWLELARYFVEQRGHGLLSGGGDRGHDRDPGPAYWQDHLPVREATTVAGHAVRQLYLLAGATDLATETHDPELRAALERVWDAMVATKTYVTGGVGARHEWESFGDPYELPPDRAYTETCAAIASVQWSWRMALLTGEAKYSDLVERTLFNGFLSGVGLDGDSWLYVNPLQVREEYADRGGDQSARRTPLVPGRHPHRRPRPDRPADPPRPPRGRGRGLCGDRARAAGALPGGSGPAARYPLPRASVVLSNPGVSARKVRTAQLGGLRSALQRPPPRQVPLTRSPRSILRLRATPGDGGPWPTGACLSCRHTAAGWLGFRHPANTQPANAH